MACEKILLVEDDPDLRETCACALSKEGYQVVVARDGPEGLQRAREERPSLAVIDIFMPGMSGIELCQSLRNTSGVSNIPILFSTGGADITDKATGFAVGGDDYLTKPYDMRELVIRVRALLRRASEGWRASEPAELAVGTLRLDRSSYTVTTADRKVLLTPTESQLLYFLMSHPGHVFSSAELLEKVWGYPPRAGSKSLVRAHILNIREKIEPVPSRPWYLISVGRSGYTVGGVSPDARGQPVKVGTTRLSMQPTAVGG